MCDVIQGYGLTETSAGATIAKGDDKLSGHVGRPLPCCGNRLIPQWISSSFWIFDFHSSFE
jgi:long-subunit acyl-CoA synthetase (AMP-forming)